MIYTVEWSRNVIDVATACDEPSRLPLLARLPARGREDDVTRTADDVMYLLHSVRRDEKVEATGLKWQGSELQSTVQTFSLPISYTGWFQVATAVVDLNSNTTLNSIEEIVTTQTTVFLNDKPLHGLLLDRDPSSRALRFNPTTIPSGNILNVGNIFCNPSPNERNCCSCLNQTQHQRDDQLYLQCTDQTGKSILVPLKTLGQFTKVASRNGALQTTDRKCVVQIAEIVKGQHAFPLTVKLVRGTPPAMEDKDGFTGILRLQEVFAETSLIGCRISSNKPPAFIEFPRDSGVQFKIAENWETLRTNAEITKAMNFCETNVEQFKSEIQVIKSCSDLRVKPDLPPKPRIRPSIPKRAVHTALTETKLGTVSGEADQSADSQQHQHATHRCNLVARFGHHQYLQSGAAQTVETSFIQSHGPHHYGVHNELQKRLCHRTSSSSAPSMPPPGIPVTEHCLSAFDEDGFLIPLENRTQAADGNTILPPLEFRTEAKSERNSLGGAGNPLANISEIPQWELYVNIPAPAVELLEQQPSPLISCDPERLEAFLEDSVAAVTHLHEPRLPDVDSYDDNNIFQAEGRNQIPLYRIRSDDKLNFDGVIENKSDDYGTTHNMPHMLPLPAHLRSSYHGFDSLAKTDSGLGTWRRFRMHHHSQELFSETWVPPSDIESMSVEEVLLGLRYIGTREALVQRFGQEQIDGKLLIEMDDELLREGFPDMNALERKKVLDFAHGWRPKRTLML